MLENTKQSEKYWHELSKIGCRAFDYVCTAKLRQSNEKCRGMINIYGQLIPSDLQPLCCLACPLMEGN